MAPYAQAERGSLVGWLNGLLGRNDWPPDWLRARWERTEVHQALRDTNESVLRSQAYWGIWRQMSWSPLARMISRASANMLFSEPPEVSPQSSSDEARMDFLMTEQGLDSELHRAAVISSSEGAVWGRIIVDPGLVDVPIICFESPRTVIPAFRGRFVSGAVFVEEAEDGNSVYRRFEVYAQGAIFTYLYRGTNSSLGYRLNLEQHPLTQGRAESVLTGFDQPLCAFIPNSVDGDPTEGVSDYRGIEDRLLGVTEVATIGMENLKLAGKKRALVDGKYLDQGRLRSDDLLVNTAGSGVVGEAPKPLQMLEYSFDAANLTLWLESLVDTTLQFAGIAPELVGRNVQGGPLSGTALRLRMIHSLLENAGKGRYWDRGLARMLRMAAVIDSRRTTEGGFGRKWSTPDSDPKIERADGLPRDDTEAAQQLVALVGAEAISFEQRVRWLHPDWNDEKVTAEVDAIKASTLAAQAGAPSATPATIPGLNLPSLTGGTY